MSKGGVLLVLAIIAGAVVAVVATRSSDHSKNLSAGRSSTTAVGRASDGSLSAVAGGGTTPGNGGPGAANQDKASSRIVTDTTAMVRGDGSPGAVPVTVRASKTENLTDGEAVALHAVAKKDSFVYGFEAWLCRAGETYSSDADIRPTFTGKCASRPLSALSQKTLDVRSPPPFAVADGTFKVGIGSDSYQTDDGQSVTVTCNARTPCALVLKLQYPNGYGFATIPITFR